MNEMYLQQLGLVVAMSQIAAGVALLNGIATAVGQGRIVASAIEAMARQPESAGSARSTMFIGLAMAETSGIYGLVISLLLLFANPVIPVFERIAGALLGG